MTLDLTFKQVCDLIKKDGKEDPKLIEAVDHLLGFALICSPVIFGPELAALLPTLAVKNELVKIGKGVFEKLSKKKDNDYLARQERMQMAYGLLCFTAFFEALDEQIPEALRKKLGLLSGEKAFLVKDAIAKTAEQRKEPADVCEHADAPLASLPLAFPHPTETLDQQVQRHADLWKQMGAGFLSFIPNLAFWEQAEEKEQAQVLSAIQKVPEEAKKCFEAQYFELVRRFEDFAVWANLQEHKKTKEMIGELSEYVRQHAALAKAGDTLIDIGLANLHAAVLDIPETLKISQATDIVESLTKHYQARVNDPIIEDREEPQNNKPRLSFPAVRDGYRAPFGDHPLLGHIAIYSINLILLRVIISDEPFGFDETQIGTHEDGARPWDRLTHIWRSWFSLDNLNGVTAIMSAERNESQITVRAKQTFQVSESRSRLETYLNVGISLGDNISSGLTGLLLFDPYRDNPLTLEDIAARLSSERIDLDFQIAIKRLFQSEHRIASEGAENFIGLVRQVLEMALHGDKHEELEHIVFSLRRGVRRLRQGDLRRMHVSVSFEKFGKEFHPKMVAEVAMRNPQAALVLLQVGKEITGTEWNHRYTDAILELGFGRHHPIDLNARNPEISLAWLQLIRELDGGRFLERYGPKLFHPDFMERVLDPRYLLELSERNPESVLAWLQLVRELGGGRLLERYGPKLFPPKFFERALDPHLLLELSERNPETTLLWLQFILEVGGQRFLEKHGKELFDEALVSFAFAHPLRQKPSTLAVALRLARAIESPQVTEGIVQWLDSFFLGSAAGHSAFAALPLASLRDLHWLASRTGHKKLMSELSVVSRLDGSDQ